jgi:dTDP-4-amino-4,6-dideoxygalactose transaminase
MWKIPLSDLNFDEAEERAVIDVLRSKWLTMGDVTKRFEGAFAELIGVKHAIAVSNCTAALQLAYRALGVGRGDEVILPSLTFVATANAAVVEGGSVVLADVRSEQDLTISPEDVAARVTPRTKVITVVHYAGYPCDMAPILETARSRGLAVVEDCAHSPGASYGGVMTGAIGDVGCFSFFSNKNMTTGEGGMLTTNRDDLAAKLRLLRSHGMTTLTLDRHRGHSFSYDVVEPGFNVRLTELHAALGLVQLGKLPAANARRREIVMRYRAGLAGSDRVTVPFSDREGVWHILPVLLRPGADRDAFMTRMREAGIQTSIHYPPIHGFTAYRGVVATDGLSITDAVARRLVTLPLHPGLPDADVDTVVSRVRELA